MVDPRAIFEALTRHGVPFAVIGGHAVNFHGFGRATEGVDVIWLRSEASGAALFAALSEIDARYIGREIDPQSGLEKTYPVTPARIHSSLLLMLWTRHGFLDLFDYVPSFPAEDVERVLSDSIKSGELRYVSLPLLRQMNRASGRTKDLLDLEQLPE